LLRPAAHKSSRNADYDDLVRIGFIGCDDTATILARGWGERILCADANRARAIGLAEQIGGDALTSYGAVARRAEIVLLCHERAHLGEIAAAVAPLAGIVVSTLEKTPLDAVRHAYPERSVYRVAVIGRQRFDVASPSSPRDHRRPRTARCARCLRAWGT
jgi:hypothetical protein